jgi:protease PrsW
MNLFFGLLIALFGGITTTTVYVAIVWRLDRYEKEPLRLLALAFIWGMAPAIILSIMLEVGASGAFDGETAGNLLSDAAVAPIIEETIKGLALLAFLVFAYRELDDVLDGIVYGAMIGLGFALTENFFYVLGSVDESGLGTGIAVLFLRTIIFGVNHAFFTGVTGAAVGAARLTRGNAGRLLLIVAGWLLAVLFHSVHNLGAALAESTDMASLGVSFLSDWGGILILFIVVALVWRKERCWIIEELADEINSGLLTGEQYVAISSTAGRQRLLARTLRQDGWTAYRRTGRLCNLLTELAFKKRQLRLMGNEPATAREIDRLRLAIAHVVAHDGIPSATAT